MRIYMQIKNRQVPTYLAAHYGPEEPGDEAEALEASERRDECGLRRDIGRLHFGRDDPNADAQVRGGYR